MNLLELKKSVDDLVSTGHGGATVLVTLSERCAGARASVGIKGIFRGFDFESVQLRIEPLEPICKRGRAKDDVMEMNVSEVSGQRKFYFCPVCEERVRKDSRYCSNCGQHLMLGATDTKYLQ